MARRRRRFLSSPIITGPSWPSGATSRRTLKEKEQQRKERDPVKDRIAELKKQAEGAVSRFKRQEASLFEHGRPKWSYDEHQQLLREFVDERNRTLRAVREEAMQIAKEQRELIDLYRDVPPDSILSSSERSEVNARLDFIRSMLSNASPEQLATKIRAAHTLGSKAEKFAVWQVAGERYRDYQANGQATATFQFKEQLDELDRGLFLDEFVRRASGPDEIAQAADEIDKFCFTRSKGATNIADTIRPDPPFLARQRYDRGGQPVVPTGGEPPTGEVANG